MAFIVPAEEAPILNFLSSYIGSFHIYGFVLASGYLYAYVRYERKGYKNFVKFIKKSVAVARAVYICHYYLGASDNSVFLSL